MTHEAHKVRRAAAPPSPHLPDRMRYALRPFVYVWARTQRHGLGLEVRAETPMTARVYRAAAPLPAHLPD